MKRMIVFTVFVMVIAWGTVQAGGDAAAGQSKAAVCAACHGADGNSTVALWPKLAGQHEAYLLRQTQLIRDGGRQVPEMTGIVAALTDQDLADISAYYASQSVKPGQADVGLVRQGSSLFRVGNLESGVAACSSCHGPSGRGDPANGYASLAGQHADYTEKMLKSFRDGNTFGEQDKQSEIMSQVARLLTDDEITALASFIEGLYTDS